MDKFMDADIFETLHRLMSLITEKNQRDIFNDAAILEQCAVVGEWQLQTFVWVAWQGGTDLCLEYEVMQRGTSAYSTLATYKDDKSTHAYMIEITHRRSGNPYGHIYQLDIREYWEYVERNAVEPSVRTEYFYRDGESDCINTKAYDPKLQQQLGIRWEEVIYSVTLPQSTADHAKVLFKEYEQLHPHTWESRTLDRHIAQILTAHTTREAERVTALMVGNVIRYKKVTESVEIALSDGFIKKAGAWEFKLLWANIPGEYTSVILDKQAGNMIVHADAREINQYLEQAESHARVCNEINRIAGELYAMPEPNSPNGKAYVVDVTDMMGNLSREEIDIFWEKTPFETMQIGHVAPLDGFHARVEADEIHRLRGDVTDAEWTPVSERPKTGRAGRGAAPER